MNSNNIAVVTDWLVNYAGAERVIKEMMEIFPAADLFSVIDFLSAEGRAHLQGKHATTTFIQRLPKAARHYQKYLPLMPLAIEQLDVSSYDIVLSSSHAVAKGVLVGPDQLHISYVHSPMRYAWDLQHQYLRESGLQRGLKGTIAKMLLHKLRLWDYRTANGVDHFIANSHFIARRIRKIYGRDAEVIYPPVNIDQFQLQEQKENYYLTASRLVPYKKVDLIVEAFSAMPDKKLVVIGDGPDMAKVKAKAGSNVEILGYQRDAEVIKLMQQARAFVFAAEEDFGISPVEAQACGTPVIAFGKGGVLETVRPLEASNPTGLFFPRQTCAALCEAVERFEREGEARITPVDCRNQALKFSEARFRRELADFVATKWQQFSAARMVHY